MPTRLFLSAFSADLQTSMRWYVSLFGFEVVFESDWFVHLQSAGNESLEIGLISRSSEIVPDGFANPPTGAMLTIVVDDVDAVHRAAVEAGLTVQEPPRDLFYGQRRMVLIDPDGLAVDVSSECPPDPKWLASLG